MHTTSASSGSDAATSPANTEVWDPTATHSAGTPTSPAYSRRAVCTEASYPAAVALPCCHVVTASRVASATALGGSPMVAALR